MISVVILAVLVSAALAAPASRVVGGDPAVPHSHKYIGSLERLNFIFWGHSCGCSLMHLKWCLTAAHCVDGASPNNLRVKLGKHDRSASEEGEKTFGVSRIVMHSGYSGNLPGYPNDIALLELNDMVQISDTIDTIQMADGNENLVGKNVKIAGWGRTQMGSSGSLPNILQEVKMPKISNSQCKSLWESVDGTDINQNHICVYDSTHTTSACNGDSGGPMIDDSTGTQILLGVTSWGVNGCYGTYPSVYTRVANYRGWIAGIIGN